MIQEKGKKKNKGSDKIKGEIGDPGGVP